METFKLAGFPAPFCWHIAPPAWSFDQAGTLIVHSGPSNDYFHDPAGAGRVASAPCALMEATDTSFIVGVHVSVGGISTFDAGVLFVRVDEEHWAKFCVELSPAGLPTIVSVVTRGVSDDCNSAVLTSPAAFLRVAKSRRTMAFHYSVDAAHWHLVRYFSLGEPAAVQLGWVAQSPMGDGCEVRFSNFSYRTGDLTNLRDGQ